MTASRGMIGVHGITYRIVQSSGVYDVVRLLDDRRVGAFRHASSLEIVAAWIERDLLLDVAKEARRSGKLPWDSPARASRMLCAVSVSAARVAAFISSWFPTRAETAEPVQTVVRLPASGSPLAGRCVQDDFSATCLSSRGRRSAA